MCVHIKSINEELIYLKLSSKFINILKYLMLLRPSVFRIHFCMFNDISRKGESRNVFSIKCVLNAYESNVEAHNDDKWVSDIIFNQS